MTAQTEKREQASEKPRVVVVCAWCPLVVGLEGEVVVSHGMCVRHQAEMREGLKRMFEREEGK